jgi:hypothetical protein
MSVSPHMYDIPGLANVLIDSLELEFPRFGWLVAYVSVKVALISQNDKTMVDVSLVLNRHAICD